MLWRWSKNPQVSLSEVEVGVKNTLMPENSGLKSTLDTYDDELEDDMLLLAEKSIVFPQI